MEILRNGILVTVLVKDATRIDKGVLLDEGTVLSFYFPKVFKVSFKDECFQGGNIVTTQKTSRLRDLGVKRQGTTPQGPTKDLEKDPTV
uniref:Uncharacterized protein n=1 Tax=Solanum tuberosum TaxID=4113 RepID=M1DCL3_SOLTU